MRSRLIGTLIGLCALASSANASYEDDRLRSEPLYAFESLTWLKVGNENCTGQYYDTQAITLFLARTGKALGWSDKKLASEMDRQDTIARREYRNDPFSFCIVTNLSRKNGQAFLREIGVID